MYDTARRVTLVKQRVRENTRRRQRRGIYGLSAMCTIYFHQSHFFRVKENILYPNFGDSCGNK